MSTNIINFDRTNSLVITQEQLAPCEQPAMDQLLLHSQIQENWRWYGVKPEVRHLYELWAEMEAEDRARAKNIRRIK